METTLSNDEEKRLEDTISTADELVAEAKEMPLESQPLEQFSAGYPTHIYFRRLLKLMVRMIPLLRLQPPFQYFFDDDNKSPDYRVFPDNDEVQAGVAWLDYCFIHLLFQYGLRKAELSDFENPEKYEAAVFPRDARENRVWQNWPYLGEGAEYPFPHLDDSIIKALENSINHLRGLVPTEVIELQCAAEFAKDLPILNENAPVAYEILLEQQPHRGVTVPELLQMMDERGCEISTSVLTGRIVPELKPYGIENTPKKGYRIPESRRPNNL